MYNAEQHKSAETDFSGKASPRVWFWKGNHKGCNHPGGTCASAMGWQRDQSQALVPVLVAMANDKRHSVRIEEEGPNASGDVLMGWQEKGFEKLEGLVAGSPLVEEKQKRRIAGEIAAKVRPSAEVVEIYLEQGAREIQTVAREEKWAHELITKTVAEFRKNFAKSNEAPKPEAAHGRA